MSQVAIIQQDEYNLDEIQCKISQALNDLKLWKTLEGKRILIKPNCTGAFPSDTGRTTHPVFLEALVAILQDRRSEITIGESSSIGIDTRLAYEATGIKDVAARCGVSLIDFKTSAYKKIVKTENRVLKIISFPEEIFQADIIISLAKMKTNFVSYISCSMKNLKGLLLDQQKRECHMLGLGEAVSDIYASLPENKCIAVVDGILGSELYEPKHAGVIVISSDLLAADSVCAKIMGMHPLKVAHLKFGFFQSLGEMSLEKMKLFGALATAVPPFKNSPPGLAEMEKIFQVHLIDGNPCSSCLGGLYLGLKKIQKIQPELLKKLQIAIGCCRELQLSKTVIRYGNCSFKGGECLAVPGCPPTSQELINKIQKLIELNLKEC